MPQLCMVLKYVCMIWGLSHDILLEYLKASVRDYENELEKKLSEIYMQTSIS